MIGALLIIVIFTILQISKNNQLNYLSQSKLIYENT
ncbi:hypothetical protein SAMN06265350_10786 [Solitalea koreensis]|uniref:Uncharacterized protein n=1 Tax=Solitalea koreensis TaxID=543615 RepID=A0A521DMR4_9SPHI|nr:hypothetical protein SAMN06265350_10786 [Solitalea koreensis]